MLRTSQVGLTYSPAGRLYAPVTPKTLLPARTETGELLAVQHPRDGQWGVPCLTAADELVLFAAGVVRRLPAELGELVRRDQGLRIANATNCSDDDWAREQYAESARWWRGVR